MESNDKIWLLYSVWCRKKHYKFKAIESIDWASANKGENISIIGVHYVIRYVNVSDSQPSNFLTLLMSLMSSTLSSNDSIRCGGLSLSAALKQCYATDDLCILGILNTIVVFVASCFYRPMFLRPMYLASQSKQLISYVPFFLWMLLDLSVFLIGKIYFYPIGDGCSDVCRANEII